MLYLVELVLVYLTANYPQCAVKYTLNQVLSRKRHESGYEKLNTTLSFAQNYGIPLAGFHENTNLSNIQFMSEDVVLVPAENMKISPLNEVKIFLMAWNGVKKVSDKRGWPFSRHIHRHIRHRHIHRCLLHHWSRLWHRHS
jgi:hypothetical protein